jgi:aminoglycoside 6'-N-acetyltransferase I
MTLNITIEPCTSKDQRGWLELRRMLWPECADPEHVVEATAMCLEPDRFHASIAYDEAEKALGFIEASMRQDYVNGTESSPVGFIEGLYVVADARQRGVGRALVEAAERWARAGGCREMASDALIDNVESHAMHRALGFTETERVVYFRKELAVDATLGRTT